MMIYLLLFLGPVAAYLLWHLARQALVHRRKTRRARIAAGTFPAAWHQLLVNDFAIYCRLPADLQRRLEQHILIFLDEKVFVGCNGFSITDEVRVFIAAQACLLILNNDNDFYPVFESILVYPDTYQAGVTHRDGYLQTDSVDVRAGESWTRGPLILAWDQVWHGALDDRDGHNVVMHEFAHKLDEENDRGEGLPVLSSQSQYADWAQVMNSAYENLCQHGDALIDDYAATSPAEFFAVLTETFFERPLELRQQHPQLYERLRLYYRLDPVQWEV